MARNSNGPGINYTLFALTVAITLGAVDRNLLNLLVDPIRADIGVSDLQFSLLQGASFSVFAALAMLPIAHLADKYSRKWIIIGCVLLWSTMTFIFGSVEGFGWLLIARAGVAVGESGFAPPALSIIRDVFPRERHATAIAVLTVGIYLGGGLSLALGGWALDMVSSAQDVYREYIDLEPWRILFIFCASCAAIVLPLLLRIREPVRHREDQEKAEWRDFGRALVERRRHVTTFIFGYMGVMSMYGAISAWTPTVFIRTYAWTQKEAGLAYGGVSFLAGVCGALIGGWIADRMVVRSGVGAELRVAVVGVIMMGTGAAISGSVPNGQLALLFAGVAMAGMGVCIGLGSMSIQSMFPPVFSARAVAFYLLIVGMIGGTFGPSAVPSLAVALGHGEAIGTAYGVFSIGATIWTVAFLVLTMRLRRSATTSGPDVLAVKL